MKEHNNCLVSTQASSYFPQGPKEQPEQSRCRASAKISGRHRKQRGFPTISFECIFFFFLHLLLMPSVPAAKLKSVYEL